MNLSFAREIPNHTKSEIQDAGLANIFHLRACSANLIMLRERAFLICRCCDHDQ